MHGIFKPISIAAAVLAAAASLAACAGPKPFSVDEKLWFDKAVGYDILPNYMAPYPPYVPPGLSPPPYR